MQMKTIDIRSVPPAMSTLSNVNYFSGPPTVPTTVENKDDIQHFIASLCFHVKLLFPTTLTVLLWLCSIYQCISYLLIECLWARLWSSISAIQSWTNVAGIRHKNRSWLHRWVLSKVNTPSGHVAPKLCGHALSLQSMWGREASMTDRSLECCFIKITFKCNVFSVLLHTSACWLSFPRVGELSGLILKVESHFLFASQLELTAVLMLTLREGFRAWT